MINKFIFSILTASFLIGCNSTPVEVTAKLKHEVPSTFARFVPERKDDFAWENDLVAFRAYGPAARSGAENAGIDCWLKRVDYPIINKWYEQHLEKNMSYHEDHGEGLDNYHVGSSAGCGGTSLWLDGKREPLEAWVKWEIHHSTSQQTRFTLYYEREIDGKTYQEEKTISIKLGQRLYSVKSRFLIDGKIAKHFPVTVGITTHDGKAATEYSADNGWMSAWEITDGFGLGTAVKVAPEKIKSFKIIHNHGVKDAGHALILLDTDEHGIIEYQAGYGWEKAQQITSFSHWQQYLNNTL